MALVDTGLIARYFFDEAASGTAPTQIDDHSVNVYHLTEVNYGVNDMAFTEVGGNRGLDSLDTAGDQRARRGINDLSDALRDALAGAQTVTVEVVCEVHAITASNSRIFVINQRDGSNPVVGFTSETANELHAYWNETKVSEVTIDTTRHVYHVVYDTTQATAADRIKIYIDGVEASDSQPSTPAQNDTLAIGASADLIALNRESTGNFARAMDGILYYAAIYAHAFTALEVDQNFDILTLDDDASVGGGVAGTLAATLAALTAVGVGTVTISGTADIDLAAATSEGVGSVEIEGVVDETLGVATLEGLSTLDIDGILDVNLEAATLEASDSGDVSGSLDQQLDDLTLDGIGTVDINGTLGAVLAANSLESDGVVSIEGTLAETLDSATVQSAGVFSMEGTLSVTLAAAFLFYEAAAGAITSIFSAIARTIATKIGFKIPDNLAD